MPKFWVTYKIDARFVAAVEATDIQSALTAAQSEYESADFGEVLDIIDGVAIIIEDENGNFIWEK